MLKKVLFILLFLITQISYNQEISFKTLTSEDGLSNNSVIDIENDHSSALWIGTWDGLNYYDGQKFTVFKHNPTNSSSIANNEIKKIIKDTKNNIWILTTDAISRYIGGKKFKNYSFSKKLKQISLSKNGRIRVHFNDQSISEYSFEKNAFLNIANTKILITHQQEAIYKKILLERKPNLIINDVLITKNNILFATRFNGLFTLQIVDNAYKIKNYKADFYNPESLKSNEIEEIHQDMFGDIWLAMKDGGISLINNNLLGISTITPHPNNYPHLPSEAIRAITKDSENHIWLGYYRSGLYQFSNQTNCFLPFKNLKGTKRQPWNSIRSLFTDSKGNVWAGTYGGIIKIKGDAVTYFNADDYPLFPNNRNYSFFEDNEQNLWIGCWGGIAKLNLNTLHFTQFKGQNKLNHLHVRNLIKWNDKLIIATENANLVIFDLKTGTLKTISEKDGLTGNSVFAILYLKDKKEFWVACHGGISILDENINLIKKITEKEGLPSHMVYGLIESNNFIWVSTTKGISKINTINYKVEKINNNIKWQASEFSEGAYFKDLQGMLYFGGVKGLNYFNPKDVTSKAYLPKINVRIDEKDAPRSTKKDYHENNLQIEIKPIAFKKNTANKILYKLDNYDTKWRTLKDRQNIFYKNIPFGNYVFLVKNSLDPSKKVLAYNIEITTPFYANYWFLFLGFSLLTLLIGYYIYSKKEHSIKHQKVINTENNWKIKHLEREKEELLKINNHINNKSIKIQQFERYTISKFKKPLMLINENLSEATISPEKKEIIDFEIKHLLNSVIEWDSLKDLSKVSDYKPSIVPAKLIQKHIQSYQKECESHHIELQTSFDSSVEYLEINMISLKLIIQYLVTVFIDYKKERTSLLFTTKISNKYISTTVTTKNAVFANNIEAIEAYNIYFKNVKELITSMKGSYIKNVTNDHINLTLKIPIKPILLSDTSTNHLIKTTANIPNITSDKKIILIYTNQEDFYIAETLLRSDNYQLVFENNIKDVSKYVSNSEIITLLLFYNVPFSSDLLNICHFIQQNRSTPTMYISESLDYSLQENLEEVHIDEILQLPKSKKFIIQKIQHLISQKKETTVYNPTSSNHKKIEKAIKIIEESYSNSDFNVEALIVKLKISRVKCFRIFKEVTHQSPSNYINQYRMRKALDFIKEDTLNISEIAFECGFNDPKYFSKVFKKYYGISPKKYIQKNSKHL